MLPDLSSLLLCLVIPVACPHCGHRCERVIGPIRTDGIYNCPGCGRAAIIDASQLDREVAAAAERLREQALEIGRSLEGGASTADDERPRPAGRPGDEPN